MRIGHSRVNPRRDESFAEEDFGRASFPYCVAVAARQRGLLVACVSSGLWTKAARLAGLVAVVPGHRQDASIPAGRASLGSAARGVEVSLDKRPARLSGRGGGPVWRQWFQSATAHRLGRPAEARLSGTAA